MKKNVKMALILNFVLILLMSWSSIENSKGVLVDQQENDHNIETGFKTMAFTPSQILVDVSHGNEVYIPAKTSPMGGFLEGTQEFNVTTLLW